MLAALVLDGDGRRRIALSLVGRGAVHFCTRREELYSLTERGDATAILAEPRDAHGLPLAPTVSLIRARFPLVPVIAYIPGGRSQSADIVDIVRAGANELVRLGFDDVGVALRAAMAGAQAGCVTDAVKQALKPQIASATWPIVAFCVDHGWQRLSVEAFALGLMLNRRTLARRLELAGLPGPLSLLGWCRLLIAARMLETSSQTAERIALALDYPSGAAFRNMLWRYTKLRPRELCRNGGLEYAVTLFKATISLPHAECGTRRASGPHPKC